MSDREPPAGAARAGVARAESGAGLDRFTVVMATGIVSAALLQAGLPWLSGVLLGIAAAAFTILLARSGWRTAVFRAGRDAGLGRPDRAFASFALVAAGAVLASRLATAGAVGVAGALAAVTVAAWPILTWLVPVRVARHPDRVAIADVNGTWYLWAVATESLAIVAAFLPQLSGLGPGSLRFWPSWPGPRA